MVIVGGGEEAAGQGQAARPVERQTAHRRGSCRAGTGRLDRRQRRRTGCRSLSPGSSRRRGAGRSPRPAMKRRIARSPKKRAAGTSPSTPSTAPNSAISSRRRWSTARRWPLPSAPKAPDRCWRRSCAPGSTVLLSPSLGALAGLANSFRAFGREGGAEGRRAPPLLERVLQRRAGACHGNRPYFGSPPRRHGIAGTPRPDLPRATSRWSAPGPAPKTC